MPRDRAESATREEETYHLMLDDALERRLDVIAAALGDHGEAGARLLGFDDRLAWRPVYRLVLPCRGNT